MSHRYGAPTIAECGSTAHSDRRPITRHDDAADRSAANRAIAISAIVLAATGAVELAVAVVTNSVGLLGDAFHNLADVSTSLAVFLGFRASRRLPTRSRPYGFDRAEDLAGLGVAAVIWASAVFAGVESFRKLIHHGPTDHLPLGMAAAVIGILGNQVVAHYKLRVGRRIQSATLISDAQHSWLDALSSAGALAGLIAVAAGWPYGDPIAGFAVTLFICHVGWEVTGEILGRLMDGIDPEILHTAEHAAAEVAGVRHAHARGRWTGRTLHLELECWLDADLSLARAEAIGRSVQDGVFAAVPEARQLLWLPRGMPAV
jgi:cation diffusion facilitator family transporter